MKNEAKNDLKMESKSWKIRKNEVQKSVAKFMRKSKFAGVTVLRRRPPGTPTIQQDSYGRYLHK